MPRKEKPKEEETCSILARKIFTRHCARLYACSACIRGDKREEFKKEKKKEDFRS
jgi:hypothetical protein